MLSPVSAVRMLLNVPKLGSPQTDPSNRLLSFSYGPLCLQSQACPSRQAAAVKRRGLAHRRLRLALQQQLRQRRPGRSSRGTWTHTDGFCSQPRQRP